MSRQQEPWTWEIGVSVVIGLPVYWAGYFYLSLPIALLIHLVLIACYAGLLRYFGRGSVIEMGLPILILSFLVLVLAPVFERINMKKAQQESEVIQKGR
ncbi:MAG TPA: hypothetical protein VF600_18970 [Abditibacteriaceae bacterium]|jgi:hypothetical protein